MADKVDLVWSVMQWYTVPITSHRLGPRPDPRKMQYEGMESMRYSGAYCIFLPFMLLN
jgi:hypothetical protein